MFLCCHVSTVLECAEKMQKTAQPTHTDVVVVVVVVGFIHCNLKHGYFYVDYSIEYD